MSPYAEARHRQLGLIFALVAIFLIVAMVLGPLSEKAGSFLAAVLLLVGIGGFAWCMLSLGRLALRCPHCKAPYHLSTMAKPPAICSSCGLDLSSWYNSPEDT
jgi:hypothetical protein